MKVIKIIDKNKSFTTKNGKEKPSSYFVIEHDNGKRTAIKPLYNDGYKALDFDCTIEVKEKKTN